MVTSPSEPASGIVRNQSAAHRDVMRVADATTLILAQQTCAYTKCRVQRVSIRVYSCLFSSHVEFVSILPYLFVSVRVYSCLIYISFLIRVYSRLFRVYSCLFVSIRVYSCLFFKMYVYRTARKTIPQNRYAKVS